MGLSYHDQVSIVPMAHALAFILQILLGEAPALMTIFVKEFWQLLVLRALTGEIQAQTLSGHGLSAGTVVG